jgi:triosephosphate isomerase
LSKIRLPALIINFKNYREALGRRALELAKTAEKVAKETGASIAVAPPQPTLMLVANSVDVPVLAQHVDDVEAGSTTGFVPVESIKEAGAAGSIVNHSEHKLPRDKIARVVELLRGNDLTSLVCASTPEEAEALAAYAPDIIAVEPPELIGSGRAVSKVSPEVVTDSVKSVRKVSDKIAVLCGAGIVSGDDVAAALKLGAQGVLVASGIVKSKDPYAKILEMAKPLI